MQPAERKKTIGYIAMFSSLVMVLAFVGPMLGGSPSSPGLGFIIWGTAPLLVGLLLRAVTRDWSDVGLRPAFRQNARWYLISVLAFPVAMVLTLLIGAMTSVSAISGFSTESYLKMVLPATAMFLIFAVFEEFGWRGYLVPKLASIGINGYGAAAIVEVVWATWHLPYLRELKWVYSSEDLVTFMPRFYLGMLACSLLYNEIRLITGSVWPAVLMHGLTNSIQHPLAAEYLKIAAGQEYLGSIGDGLFTIAFIGLVGIVVNRWRMRRERSRVSVQRLTAS